MRTGPPVEAFESERIDWVPLVGTPGLIARREIVSGTTADARPCSACSRCQKPIRHLPDPPTAVTTEPAWAGSMRAGPSDQPGHSMGGPSPSLGT
jgi:hypothetical protein